MTDETIPETIKLPEPVATVRRWTSSVTVDIPPRFLPRLADRAPLFTADQVRAAVLEERRRLSALYAVVSNIIESPDMSINLTRLHDYLGGEDVSPDSIACRAED